MPAGLAGGMASLSSIFNQYTVVQASTNKDRDDTILDNQDFFCRLLLVRSRLLYSHHLADDKTNVDEFCRWMSAAGSQPAPGEKRLFVTVFH
jgi:hypothetical protein